MPMLSALALFATCPCGRAETFDDLWLTRIKPPPYGGVATEFDDTIAADGKRLRPYRDLVCAHMLEQMGQRLRVTNVANGKSVVCTVADKGPNRRFWPRREIDLTPPASKAIGCDGMCNVSLERVATKRPVDQKEGRPDQREVRRWVCLDLDGTGGCIGSRSRARTTIRLKGA